MALIRKAKGRRSKQSPSGYSRVFGDADLGNLLSRVQATVISAGSELEKLILERAKHVEDFDTFITNLDNREPGIFVAAKSQIKKSTIIKTHFEPDLLAFDLQKRICYVIEVKDGDTFDTKKSEGEKTTLHDFVSDVSPVMAFAFKVRVCSFNARDTQEIYDGLKRRFSKDELLTGKDLCELLQISYDDILAARSCDQAENLEYFVDELMKMPTVESAIRTRTKTPDT